MKSHQEAQHTFYLFDDFREARQLLRQKGQVIPYLQWTTTGPRPMAAILSSSTSSISCRRGWALSGVL